MLPPYGCVVNPAVVPTTANFDVFVLVYKFNFEYFL